jgi:hypothetical protein
MGALDPLDRKLIAALGSRRRGFDALPASRARNSIDGTRHGYANSPRPGVSHGRWPK